MQRKDAGWRLRGRVVGGKTVLPSEFRGFATEALVSLSLRLPLRPQGVWSRETAATYENPRG